MLFNQDNLWSLQVTTKSNDLFFIYQNTVLLKEKPNSDCEHGLCHVGVLLVVYISA